MDRDVKELSQHIFHFTVSLEKQVSVWRIGPSRIVSCGIKSRAPTVPTTVLLMDNRMPQALIPYYEPSESIVTPHPSKMIFKPCVP